MATDTPANDVEILGPYLTAGEVARLLRLSKTTVWEMVRLNEIPHRRLSKGRHGRILFIRRELDEWIENQAGSTIQQAIERERGTETT